MIRAATTPTANETSNKQSFVVQASSELPNARPIIKIGNVSGKKYSAAAPGYQEEREGGRKKGNTE